MLTTAAMSSALISLVASETLWTILLKRVDPAQAGTRVLTAYILRTVLRECAGIVGIVAAIVAASNGILRVFPAYWVNMVPAALFLVYLFAHWPRHKNERAPFISG
jgi:TolB-like protein